jgi:hypothetical protein
LVFERSVSEVAFDIPEFTVLDARDYGAARVNFLRFDGP